MHRLLALAVGSRRDLERSDLAIAWPIENPTLSERDKRLPTLASYASRA